MSGPLAGIQHDLDSAIETHLFILCPNNSGSTLLKNALATSSATWNLSREGQHAFGFVGPQLGDTGRQLVWAAESAWIDEYRDETNFDWDQTRAAWYAFATANTIDASVFVEKSPPFLLIADQLRQSFLNARFIMMVRTPLATYEGILRRERNRADSQGRELAAHHIVNCLRIQRENQSNHADVGVFFTYEQLCAEPAVVTDQIRSIAPAVTDLDLERSIPVKGMYDEPLRNMNDEQIGRLSKEDRSVAERIFSDHSELFAHFGY
jgi:hypothetical protein